MPAVGAPRLPLCRTLSTGCRGARASRHHPGPLSTSFLGPYLSQPHHQSKPALARLGSATSGSPHARAPSSARIHVTASEAMESATRSYMWAYCEPPDAVTHGTQAVLPGPSSSSCLSSHAGLGRRYRNPAFRGCCDSTSIEARAHIGFCLHVQAHDCSQLSSLCGIMPIHSLALALLTSHQRWKEPWLHAPTLREEGR